MCVCAKSLQSCPTLCSPMDCNPPDCSVHEILQSRILEWVAMPSFSRSSQARDWTHVSCMGKQVFYQWLVPPIGEGTWKIPWTEEPGRLQSMALRRVGYDWATSLSLFTFTHWRRKWQPTPVFLPGESQGRWSLVGCHLWVHTESDTTEAT